MPAERDPAENDPDIIAGELALGLLDGPERAAALRQTLADPGFARRVDAWRERLAPLIDEITEVSPPGSIWTAIERRLAGPSRASLLKWQASTGAAAAFAAALLAVVVLRSPEVPPAPAPQPMLVAQLGAPAATAMLAVYSDAQGGLIVRPAVVDTAGRVPELWVIPKGGKPVSLGVVARDRPTRLDPGSRRSLLVRDAILAVSLEPIGGSPTGQPTGPVVATGALSTI